ncbi:alpha-actinin [Blastocladiella emersonii ATCC 22665]|nr:alpha-actinin [Blastocladiella emersonii ATCC 22665]
MSQYGSRSSLNEFSPSAASTASVQDNARIMDKTWEIVQKKTFTKWVNTKLQLRGMAVTDLATELADGVALINLLEIIGDEPLSRYTKSPRLRIQKVENLNVALGFIKRRGVNLVSIGAEDIVDANEKLILGMIWTIILRFSIADISEEGLTAKEGLLLWCQRKTAPYAPTVAVKDFTFSWQDGLAFCALIHRHRPDLIDFENLNKADKHGNMALAFDVAQTHLNIPKLLDVEDVVDLVKPDERSIMTYVAQYFHAFSQLDKFEVAGRRVNKFVQVMASAYEMQNDYEKRARALVALVDDKQAAWAATTLADTYAEAKVQSNDFNEYKNSVKRTWVQEKRELDALLGNIQTKLATYHLKPYAPPAGLALADVDAHWNQLLVKEGQYKKSINAKIKDIKETLQTAYATQANQLQAELNDISLALADLDGELDHQAARVVSLQDRLPELNTKLAALHALNDECRAANIEENEYTIYSVEDLEFDLGVVTASLTKKLGFVENQRVARQMTNVTPQQLEEFETTFRHFDKDLSNTLSDIEFKASLAGLGIAYTDDEFLRVFTSVSQDEGAVNFEQFVGFMRNLTEDRTSADQLLAAFGQLANGKNTVSEADMRIAHLPAETIQFLTEVMPRDASGDNFDFAAYLAQAFPQQ